MIDSGDEKVNLFFLITGQGIPAVVCGQYTAHKPLNSLTS